MVFTIINANIDHDSLNVKISEMIYTLESENIDLRNIQLKNIKSIEACDDIHHLLELSDLAIYVTPLDSEASISRLNTFLMHYDLEKHPAIFLVLDSDTLLSVQEVTTYIDTFESFSSKHQTKIIDVQYYKDAIPILKKIAS